MNGISDQDQTAEAGSRRRGLIWVVVAVVGLIVLAGVGYFVYDATQSDDDTESTIPDDGGVDLPQDPSLILLLEDGVWFVENDGNVTMSEIEVRDDAGEVICEIGTMSPDDREACEDASENQDLVVVGQGPQGQPVEARPG